MRTSLLITLTLREITGRYRGSALGLLWSLLTPLFMLAVYTFVFGTVFGARWSGSASASTGEFAIVLFAGLIIFQVFAEVVNRAPTLIVANRNFVKKIVFPLAILAPVALGSALFHMAVSFLILFAFMLAIYGSIPLTALWLPVVLAPFCLVVLGLAWLLAALGVFVRDVNQVLGPIVTALLFLSAVFFPLSALPEWIRPWLVLNPIVFPVEQTREVLIWGNMPDFASLAVYTVAALVVAALGYLFFQKTRRGFADVI